jgi:DNA-binding transcriptional LysR family regulator
MTFSQLRTFALVAELGSLRAAAMALGVSEPAVSAAVSALRTDLGDPLFRRTGTGIALTPGGRALAARARELVRLAERTRREVAHATSAGRLRALATASCAEHVAGSVIAAFTRRVPRAAVDLTVGSSDCAAVALAEDDADIVLGVRPTPTAGQAVDAVPFLRFSRIVVAAPGRAQLTGLPWLAGPGGMEPGSEEERWADTAGLPEVDRCPSEAEALAAVRAGGGVMLALAHAVRADLARGSLVRVPMEGTPVTGLWWASVPGDGRSTSAARALQRFLTTPDATSALLSRPDRRARTRPTVRVELWS